MGLAAHLVLTVGDAGNSYPMPINMRTQATVVVNVAINAIGLEAKYILL